MFRKKEAHTKCALAGPSPNLLFYFILFYFFPHCGGGTWLGYYPTFSSALLLKAALFLLSLSLRLACRAATADGRNETETACAEDIGSGAVGAKKKKKESASQRNRRHHIMVT